MHLTSWIATAGALAVTSCQAQELSYEDSINALAYGNVALSGNSSGTVWLNITGFSPEQLPHVQKDIGLESLDNLDALVTIAGLAKIAASKGQWGDLVFLSNAFEMNAYADYVKVSSEQMQDGLLEAVSGNSSTPDADLISLYASTSSSSYLATTFNDLKNSTTATTKLEKKWLSETCDSAHRAAKSACLALINSISLDVTWKHGSPRSVCERGCCISWSANATFQLRNLTNAANSCVNFCASANVSCKIRGVSLQGTIVDQCLSNRATGCT